MAKIKFVLSAQPTFKAKVALPVAGSEPAMVEFTFKHRNKDEFQDWVKELGEKDDVDLILEVASAWELAEPFDRDSLETLTQDHMGSARAVLEKYISEQTNAKLGN